MATTKITNPELFDLGSLDTALKLPSGTTAERPTSPSTGEWRYNTTTNLIEYYDGGSWRELQSEDIPPVPSENFNTVLYTGNGSTQSITGVGFQPDFVWIKKRDSSSSHLLTTTRIGTGEQFRTNSTLGRRISTTVITSFDSDGFTLGSDSESNSNNNTFVAWCWKVNGGNSVTNTDGNRTTTIEVNDKNKICMMSYNGNATAGATLGHGLGVAPEFFFLMDRFNGGGWYIYHKDVGASNQLRFTTSGQAATSNWNGTAPDSSVITLGATGGANGSGRQFILWAFAGVAGFSKFGSYTGNGSTNGPIVNTGFEPAFLIIKNTSDVGSWFMYDNKRNTSNPRINYLLANATNVEASDMGGVDFLSNGFQIKDNHPDVNDTGDTYLYIAFAADPSAAPVLADSFGVETYQGNGGTQSLTGYGFTPSMIWFKGRTVAYDHGLYDSVRGGGSLIYPSLSQAASTVTNGVLSFDSSGVTVGSNNKANASDSTYVGWAWKANPIPTINTDGTIQSIVSANQASGFSIVKYTGNATSGATVGHGLSNAPDVVIAKGLSGSGSSWWVRDKNVSSTDVLELNSSNAQANYSSVFNNTDPTSTVVTLGSGDTNRNNETQILYCFHSIAGFSKMGTYTGTGATHAITGVGFQPDWIMGKEVDGVDSWEMVDSARGINKMVYANGANAEVTNTNFTSFDSDGFTLSSATSINENGKTYIYMAFKENPAQPAIPSGYMAYLVVAGGGSGHRSDNNNGAGGGGAGGLRSSYVRTGGGGTVESNITLTAKTYTITIGAGGADNTTGGGPAISGNDSVLDTITSIGGGGGGGVGLPAEASTSGGSGGGGGGYNSGAGAAGTANQGFAGGNGSPSTSGTFSERNGGGGGGAGSVGTTGSTSSAGAGGSGVIVPITGTNVGYAGGGSGANKAGSGIPSTSGGGTGAGTNGIGTSGAANTGGGGGGGGVASYAGKGGGSGVVILRMNTSDYSGATTGSPTVTTNGSETILTYTGSGTYVHS